MRPYEDRNFCKDQELWPNNNWRFHCFIKDKDGKGKPLYLKRATETHILRHKKIMGAATPFNPCYKQYFVKREIERKTRSRPGNENKVKSAGLRIIQPYDGLSVMR